MRSCFAASIALCFLAPLSFSQSGMTAGGEMILAAPLFLQDANVTSTITMVSVVSVPLTSKVAVFDSNGSQIGVASISLDPHTQRFLKLSELLRSWNSQASSGSVKILQDPTAKGISMTARLSIAGSVSGKAVDLEEDFQTMGAARSGTFRAATGGVMGAPIVAVWNLGAAAQTVNIQCLVENGTGGTSQIPVLAGQAAFAQACGGTGTIAPSSSQLLSLPTGAMSGGAVGVSVSGNGAPGTLAVYGFAFRNAGSIAALGFEDTGKMRSSNAVFPGVPVGATNALPGPPFQPSVALANFGSQPASVSVTYATAASPGLSANPITQAVIPPGASKTISLPALPGDPAMRNSFLVQSTAAPGTLFSSMTSVSAASPQQAISLAGRDQQRGENGGAGEWSLANGDTSTLLLFNSTNAPGTFTVHIGAKGIQNGLWAKSYELAAMETKAIDVRELIVNGEPDVKGGRILSNATEGEIAWFTPERGTGTGRLVVSNPATTTAHSVDYEIYLVLCGVTVDPYSIGFDFEDSGDAYMMPMICTAISSYACSGTPSGYGSASSYSWTSLNSSIASVSGPSNRVSASFYGDYPGQTPTQAQAQSGPCVKVGGGTASVQVPASYVVYIVGNKQGDLTTTIGLAGKSATLNSYVALGIPTPAGFNDVIQVDWGFNSPVAIPSAISTTTSGDKSSSTSVRPRNNTATISYIVGTSTQNTTTGAINVFASASASDQTNNNVAVDFKNTNSASIIIYVQNP